MATHQHVLEGKDELIKRQKDSRIASRGGVIPTVDRWRGFIYLEHGRSSGDEKDDEDPLCAAHSEIVNGRGWRRSYSTDVT